MALHLSIGISRIGRDRILVPGRQPQNIADKNRVEVHQLKMQGVGQVCVTSVTSQGIMLGSAPSVTGKIRMNVAVGPPPPTPGPKKIGKAGVAQQGKVARIR